MTRLRPDTRRPMRDLNDVFTTNRGMGSRGARDGKEICPTEYLFNIHFMENTIMYQCTKLKDVEKSYKVEILGHILSSSM